MSAPPNDLTLGLDRVVAWLSATVKPDNGYSFDLTRRDRVQIGHVLQLPDRQPPSGGPFVLVGFREEFAREKLGTGKNYSRVAEFDVVGWVRGLDATPRLNDDRAGRTRAGTLLFDDLHRAIIADRRMLGMARDVTVRGTGFAGDIVQPWRAFGVAVARVRVQFNWRAG